MHLINHIVNYLYRKYGIPIHIFSKIVTEVQATLKAEICETTFLFMGVTFHHTIKQTSALKISICLFHLRLLSQSKPCTQKNAINKAHQWAGFVYYCRTCGRWDEKSGKLSFLTSIFLIGHVTR